MQLLSAEQKKFLEEATNRYEEDLPGSEAEKYLVTRFQGIVNGRADLEPYRLGYVAEPLPGHERYRGMLAIPYIRWSPGYGSSVTQIRFRCLLDHNHKAESHGKYNSLPGDPPKLFNTVALVEDHDLVGIGEGEIDAITASLSGVPTVGISGAQVWKPHFREPFLGYTRVLVFADGDKAGYEFGEKLAKELPNVRVIPSPSGEDVNSTVARVGKTTWLESVTK